MLSGWGKAIMLGILINGNDGRKMMVHRGCTLRLPMGWINDLHHYYPRNIFHL